jgi:hypothetical protein
MTIHHYVVDLRGAIDGLASVHYENRRESMIKSLPKSGKKNPKRKGKGNPKTNHPTTRPVGPKTGYCLLSQFLLVSALKTAMSIMRTTKPITA